MQSSMNKKVTYFTSGWEYKKTHGTVLTFFPRYWGQTSENQKREEWNQVPPVDTHRPQQLSSDSVAAGESRVISAHLQYTKQSLFHTRLNTLLRSHPPANALILGLWTSYI